MSSFREDRPPESIKLLALLGSFRTGSINQAVLAVLKDLTPGGVVIDDVDLRTVPFYDGDLEADGPPASVSELNGLIRAADGLIIITPEYNSSIPAVLKNAIDWASRGYPNSPIRGRITAVLGASPGRGGTVSAQAHLRQVLERVGAVVLDAPEVALARAQELLVDDAITDPRARADIAAVGSALVDAIRLTQDCGSISAVS